MTTPTLQQFVERCIVKLIQSNPSLKEFDVDQVTDITVQTLQLNLLLRPEQLTDLTENDIGKLNLDPQLCVILRNEAMKLNSSSPSATVSTFVAKQSQSNQMSTTQAQSFNYNTEFQIPFINGYLQHQVNEPDALKNFIDMHNAFCKKRKFISGVLLLVEMFFGFLCLVAMLESIGALATISSMWLLPASYLYIRLHAASIGLSSFSTFSLVIVVPLFFYLLIASLGLQMQKEKELKRCMHKYKKHFQEIGLKINSRGNFIVFVIIKDN